MNINEIRVGNFVYFAILNIVEVTAINPQKLISTSKNSISGKDEIYDMVSFKGNTASGNDRIEAFDPIPLTEEILLKCGFEYVEEVFSYCCKFHNIYISTIGEFIFAPFCTNDSDCWVKIKYLHQLQNLYWCLVGEEIEINL